MYINGDSVEIEKLIQLIYYAFGFYCHDLDINACYDTTMITLKSCKQSDNTLVYLDCGDAIMSPGLWMDPVKEKSRKICDEISVIVKPLVGFEMSKNQKFCEVIMQVKANDVKFFLVKLF